MKFEINSRFRGAIIYEDVYRTLKLALRGADLRDADLRKFRDDVWAVLSSAPAEVSALRQALIDGNVEGSTYNGECACLVGTLKNSANKQNRKVPLLIEDSSRPAEVWFMSIHKGDKPETNNCSKHALEWVDQWLAGVQAAFGGIK